MAGNTSGLFWDTRLMEPELNQQEKALRDYFVQEYLKDFDPYQACLRVGFQSAFAIEYAKRFMSEPYVLQRIEEEKRARSMDSDEEVKNDLALIVNGLRQASQNGPYASRVQAMRALMDLRGFVRKDDGQDGEQALIDAFREFATKAPV